MQAAVDDTKAEIAHCFVPELLVDYITHSVRNGQEKLEPAAFFVHGVCLLVDISGFTMMSERFCSEGKSGIDSLQLATNGYMGQLVDVIYSFGGDIIKFAGDALVCLFANVDVASIIRQRKDDATETPIEVSPDVILKAMLCAHVIRSVKTDTLSVHVAMSCGEMCFGILGGVENRWECLISGPCIHQLSDCLDDAPSTQAAITPECLKIVEKVLSPALQPTVEAKDDEKDQQECVYTTDKGTFKASLLTMPSGNRRILDMRHESSTPLIETMRGDEDISFRVKLTSSRQKTVINALIRQFVPAPILEEIDEAMDLDHIAEIREVVTMFMKWDSYDAEDKHRDLIELQACFYQAQRILQATGAYLRQFLVDDKGCVLIACWGMPNMSYVDNSYRALNAAAQIRIELDRLNMRTSVGITSGDVYCGMVGSPKRREYAAIGSDVNMAARVMGKAKGRLLVGQSAYVRLPKAAFELLEAIEPMTLKGKVGPMQAYRYFPLHGTKESTGPDGSDISTACKAALRAMLLAMDPYTAVSSTVLKTGNGVNVDRRTGEATCIEPNNVSARTTVHSNSSKNARGWLPFTGSAAPVIEPQRMNVVLLNGKEGSGRTSVVLWVKAQASQLRIQVVGAKLTKKDSQNDYVLWRKLFQGLMPKDLYQDSTTQRTHVWQLLRRVYPGQPMHAEHIGYPALKAALGITCSFKEELPSTPSSLKKIPTKGLWSQSMKVIMQRAAEIPIPAPVPLHDTLFKIFSHLLTIQTVLLIVEHVEHADEDSLKLLIALLSLPTRSAIVLSALMVDDVVKKKTRIGTFMIQKTYEKDAIKASLWSQVYRDMVQRHSTTTTIVLEIYTLAEIERMLADVLGAQNATTDLAQVIQEFAGGSCFWVREMVRCIKENGAEQFLSAVDADTEPLTNSNKTLIASSKKSGITLTSERSSLRPKPRHNSISISRGSAHGGATATPSRRASLKSQLTRAASNNNVVGTTSQVQLDKLILGRFNSLSSNEQRILRTASIIGVTFTSPLLLGILPRHLKEHLSVGIDALLHQKWLYQDTEVDTLYQFAHPHHHKIIYQLTPSSERAHMHHQIAVYIEETYGADKTQFAALSSHYQHCDHEKALMYCCQAVLTLNDSTKVLFDFGDCVDLLYEGFTCVRTTYDCEVLQQLVKNTVTAIEMCYEMAKAERMDSRASNGWSDFFFNMVHAMSVVTTRASGVGAHASSKYSGKVVPGELSDKSNLQNSIDFASSGKEGEDDGAETDFADDDGYGGPDYERRAKRTFIAQLRRLEEQLMQKQTELLISQGAGAITSGENSGVMTPVTGPAEWQKDYLCLEWPTE